MPESDTGETVTDVLHFPWRDGRVVHAIRVDYALGGFTRGAHRHPPGAYVYVIDGSVMFGIDDKEPVTLKAGDSFYEPPGALHSVSRNASEEVPASLIAFFVLRDGEFPDQLSSIARLVDRGELLPAPVEVFPLMSAREAFAPSLEPGRRGRVVLAVA
jgi:quercetin dioxygenase-like cupin family protein